MLYCKRSEQARATLNLELQGVECCYPQILADKIRRGQRSQALEPLFPNYVFANFDPEAIAHTTVCSTRGVIDFVRQGPRPVVVDAKVVSNLQAYEQSDEQQCAVSQAYVPGDRVEMSRGPFAGVEAICQESDGDKRAILLINMINQPVEIKEEYSAIKRK
ncbi:MAG: transcription/translation regulatory transformer protein RfaH [Pseudomonadota bacterium]